jgi:hypothetical protein
MERPLKIRIVNQHIRSTNQLINSILALIMIFHNSVQLKCCKEERNERCHSGNPLQSLTHMAEKRSILFCPAIRAYSRIIHDELFAGNTIFLCVLIMTIVINVHEITFLSSMSFVLS